MKRTAFALFCILCLTTFAQDAVKVAPANFKVLLDNDQVRVLEYHSKKGETVASHSHPPYVVYALGDSKTKFTNADGSTRVLDVKKGQALYAGATTHSQESLTDTDVIVVELKQAK